MIIPVKTQTGSYNIYVQRGALETAGTYLNLNRKVLIVTDTGVPAAYAQKVAAHCKEAFIITVKMGEKTKSIETFTYLLSCLVDHNFTRSDCIVAVGGGVVGDLAGFVASCFMRGIDFYNIPTTFLSQVDSSIGGKTAVDFMGIKNIVGAFYPPKAVIIDPDTLKTLPKRQVANGLAESVKMALIQDAELFDIFEKGDVYEQMDTIILRSLQIKKYVVEQDEKEAGLRKILNFGHTLAHGIEAVNSLDTYYHGECVAMGMLPMCSDAVRERLIPVLQKLSLPTSCDYEKEALLSACRHDKKTSGDHITVVYVPEVGTFELRDMPFSEFEKQVREVL
ncbi:MAG: 3-dehydroquinate synthase [Ruminococcaceae bacterium]|nr:3-dehydroquinate synthase [Oscillospiraceae bacterium]